MLKVTTAVALGLLALAASSPDDPPSPTKRKAKAVPSPSHAPIVRNDDLPSGEPARGTLSAPTPSPSPSASEPSAAPTPGAEGSPAPEAAPAPAPQAASSSAAHDEAYWRERTARAQKEIKRLEDEIDWTKKRVMLLRMDLVVPVDGAREFNRRTEIDSLMQEQARLEKALVEAKKEPDKIREEGRREGVLPAWFR